MRRAECICGSCGSTFIAKRSDAQWCAQCWPSRRQAISHASEQRRAGKCLTCGGRTARKAIRCQSCAGKERAKHYFGERNPNWKGGQTRHSSGYIQIRHPRGKHAYTLQHHLVWESVNGPLPKGWVIHHLNGIKTDNRLENLAGMPRNEHHSHPRKALIPYENRIRELERLLGILPSSP